MIWDALKVSAKLTRRWVSLGNLSPANFLPKRTIQRKSIQVISFKMIILKRFIVGTFSINFQFTETIEKLTPECQQNDTATEFPVETTETPVTPITTLVPVTTSSPMVNSGSFSFK